jgi:RNA polymerase sigma factor (TIGR02999 family)
MFSPDVRPIVSMVTRGNAAYPDIVPTGIQPIPRRAARQYTRGLMDALHGTDLTTELRSGRRDSLDRLMPEVYDQLRIVARRQLALREQKATLSTTGLVHEAYLKLVDQSRIAWGDRAHFFALASVAMRHILVDRARARLAGKRDGGPLPVTLDNDEIAAEDQPAVLLELNEALDRLSAMEPRLGQVVECRFFGGLSEVETAEALDVTTRTVQRDWAKAKMLLRRMM